MTESTRRRPADGSPATRADEVLIVRRLRPGKLLVAGEIDRWTAPTLTAALGPLLAVGGDVRVDARAVTFLGSAGLRVLREAADDLSGRGRLIVVDPARPVRRAVELIDHGDEIEFETSAHRKPPANRHELRRRRPGPP
jgi:anti-anti-sigma factor